MNGKHELSPAGRFRTVLSLSLLFLLLIPACNLLAVSETTPEPTSLGTQAATTLTAAAATVVGSPVSTEPVPTGPVPTGPVPTSGSDRPASELASTGESGEQGAVPHTLPGLGLAYLDGGDVWMWTEAGEPQQLTEFGDATSVHISPDGQLVAFQRQVEENAVELWVVGSDGENARVLEDVPAFRDMDPGALGVVPHQLEWIPGTHVLAYNTRQILEGPGLVLYNDLRLVDADSLDHSTLLAPGEGGMFYYSPNAGQIAIATPDSISLLSSDASSREQVLVYEPVLTYSEYQYYARPYWAPDGSHLRVAIPPADPLLASGQPTGLWYIPSAGGKAQQVGAVVANAFSGSEPYFSPELDRLAYILRTGSPESSTYELHIAQADGSDDAVYASGTNLFFETWTDRPGVFLYSQQGDGGTVYSLGKQGEEPSSLAPGASNVASLEWVGEGRYLLLSGSYQSETWTLQVGEQGAAPETLAEIQGPLPAFDAYLGE